MKSKTKDVLRMLEQLFNGEYDPVVFSCDFPDLCFCNYDQLEKEHHGLGYYLDQVVPDICDEGEPGFDPTHMIEELKKVYEKIKALTGEAIEAEIHWYQADGLRDEHKVKRFI